MPAGLGGQGQLSGLPFGSANPAQSGLQAQGNLHIASLQNGIPVPFGNNQPVQSQTGLSQSGAASLGMVQPGSSQSGAASLGMAQPGLPHSGLLGMGMQPAVGDPSTAALSYHAMQQQALHTDPVTQQSQVAVGGFPGFAALGNPMLMAGVLLKLLSRPVSNRATLRAILRTIRSFTCRRRVLQL
jgi:hypothetical protein